MELKKAISTECICDAWVNRMLRFGTATVNFICPQHGVVKLDRGIKPEPRPGKV